MFNLYAAWPGRAGQPQSSTVYTQITSYISSIRNNFFVSLDLLNSLGNSCKSTTEF